MDEKYYIYVVVRKDLSPEQQAVQACHAVSLAGFHYGKTENATLVLLGIGDEEYIEQLAETCSESGLKVHVFREPDMNNEVTAFATEPITEDKRVAFQSIKTVRFPKGILYHLKVFWRSIKRELTD